MHAEILRPVVALAAWSMFMWLWLYVARLPAMRRAGLFKAPMVGGVGADLRAKLEPRAQWKADNYNHLMEQPTVFYAVTLSLVSLGQGFGLNATLAWAYVALRVAHSLVQVTINRVPMRFALHALGTIPLLVLTVRALILVFGAEALVSAH
jgi:hypothetical protein